MNAKSLWRDDGQNARRALSRESCKAAEYGAEYVVFSRIRRGIKEAVTGCYRHSDAEVIDATCALLSEVLSGMRCRPALLLDEPLAAGTYIDGPAMTRRLLVGVPYEDVGLMLDTGHLFHTNEQIVSQEEGLRYSCDARPARPAL
jgi:sugar phosphate isomerase/epimerase